VERFLVMDRGSLLSLRVWWRQVEQRWDRLSSKRRIDRSNLVGSYPERKDLYHKRSAINFLDQLEAPMILFQGLEDKIVPPNQAERIVEALRKKGRPVAYLTFEGEQRGFRKAENIKHCLEAELYFYSRIFGFEPADSIKPVQIENL